MKITEQTKANAQRVVDYLEMNPHKHNQKSYFGNGSLPVDFQDDERFEAEACGTTMCIAGTAAWMDAGMPKTLIVDNGRVEYIGADFLGLDCWEEREHIFYNYDNAGSLDMLRALANGDEEKFWALEPKIDYDLD
jgi:hypothetical protein